MQQTPEEAAFAAASICHATICFRCANSHIPKRVEQKASGKHVWMHKDEFCAASAQREALLKELPLWFGSTVPEPVTASVGGPVCPLSDADVEKFNALEADPTKVEELTSFCAAMEAKHGTIDWSSIPVKVVRR